MCHDICFSIFQLHDSPSYYVSLYDGNCDQTKEIEKLSGTILDDKKIISSSGRYMFVIFSKSEFFLVSNPGFIAKIHKGNEIINTKDCG